MAFRDRNHLLACLSRATHSGAPHDLAANIKQGFGASSDYKFILAPGQDCTEQTELRQPWVFTLALLAMALPGCVNKAALAAPQTCLNHISIPCLTLCHKGVWAVPP